MRILYKQDRQHIDAKMFFDLNAQAYKVVNSGAHDFALAPAESNKVLHLDIWHNTDNQIDSIKNLLDNPSVWVISNVYSNFCHERLCTVDFLFNRTKAYYQQYPWTPGTNRWYWQEFAYQDFEVPSSTAKSKIFLAPNKTHNNQRPWRLKVADLVLSYSNIGHIGNADRQSNLYLYCHHEQPWARSLDQLTGPSTLKWLAYSPPHNLYYKDTFLSIYGETVETGSSIVVTEKTYDPLIKGHFILPFSCKGFIQHLKQLGYRFPTFIDYSYDDVADDVKRFNLYQNEVQRLLSQTHQQWCDWWDANIDILLYNKRKMHEREYDRVDLLDFMRA